MGPIQHCYIDISTATSAGKTSVRIHPSEGKGAFFSDARKDAKSVRGDIEQIIGEAIDAKDRIRVIVTRESHTNSKSLREYIESNKTPEKIFDLILNAVGNLSKEIEFYNALDNEDIVNEVRSFRSSNPNSNLDEFGNYLERKGFRAKYDVGSLRLDIMHKNTQYFLPWNIWTRVNWDSV